MRYPVRSDVLNSSLLAMAAALLEVEHSAAAFEQLSAELRGICPHDHFMVLLFEPASQPQLLYCGLNPERMREELVDYLRRLYLLDPFYQAQLVGKAGLHRLSEIVPVSFELSDYFASIYRDSTVVDELRYLVPTADSSWVHILVDRAEGSTHFDPASIGALAAAEPVVRAFVRGLFRSRAALSKPTPAPAPAAHFLESVRQMTSDSLTQREVEVVELMLKGQSVKSIARILDISAGTVANHKRSIYDKLGVHSQGQLFYLFLREED